MLDTQVKMEPAVARKHYLAYRALTAEQRTAEDDAIQKSYLELSRGHAILNARVAVEAAGYYEDGSPRIAFARADMREVFMNAGYGRVSYKRSRWWVYAERGSNLEVRCSTGGSRSEASGVAVVPTIPPPYRPAKSLDRYWLMWEVPEGGWQRVPPVDPALLKRINATTFVVLAVWDLTEVERMVLAGRR